MSYTNFIAYTSKHIHIFYFPDFVIMLLRAWLYEKNFLVERDKNSPGFFFVPVLREENNVPTRFIYYYKKYFISIP